MPDTPDSKPASDDATITPARPEVTRLGDVVEVARESLNDNKPQAPQAPAQAPQAPAQPAPRPQAPPQAPAQPSPRPQGVQPPPQRSPEQQARTTTAPQQGQPQSQPRPPQPPTSPQQRQPQQPPLPLSPLPQAAPPQSPPPQALQPQPLQAQPSVAAPTGGTPAPTPGAWRDPNSAGGQLIAYLRANRRRVFWMVVAPIFAAEAIVGVLAIGPRQYRATAAVTIPSAGSSVSDVTQVVSDYRAKVGSDQVLRQVTAQTKLPASSIKSGLHTKREGTSNVVDVTYESSHKDRVVTVVRAVARESLSQLVDPELDVANRALAKAQSDFEAVQQQIIEFNAQHGLLLDAPEAYRSKVAELSRLKVQAQQAHAAGNSSRAASLDASVAQATKDVDALAAVVRDYQKLQSKHDQLQSTINSSAAKQSEAQARKTAADSANTVDVGGAKKVNVISRAARAAAITFIVALLLMVGALVLLEVLGPQRPESFAAFTAPAAQQPRPAQQPKVKAPRKKRRR